jgi:hypothetical protein
MPKDQRTKWREAKQRYRANVRNNQGQQQETEEDDGGSFWTS